MRYRRTILQRNQPKYRTAPRRVTHRVQIDQCQVGQRANAFRGRPRGAPRSRNALQATSLRCGPVTPAGLKAISISREHRSALTGASRRRACRQALACLCARARVQSLVRAHAHKHSLHGGSSELGHVALRHLSLASPRPLVTRRLTAKPRRSRVPAAPQAKPACF